MAKKLTITLATGVFFSIDDKPIDDPIDLDPYDEDPFGFYEAIIAWSRESGVTHVEDDNLVEFNVHEVPVVLLLDEYEAIITKLKEAA